MPQRLPLVFSLGALALCAGASPSHAEVTPMHRPPAVPPLPVQTQPVQTPADPIALKRDAEAQGFSDIALSMLGHSIEFDHPAPTQIALTATEPDKASPVEQTADSAQAIATDTIALKRDAVTQGFSDIALSTLGRSIEFGAPTLTEIALVEAEPEKANPVAQIAQAPTQDAIALKRDAEAKGLADIKPSALVSRAIDLGYPAFVQIALAEAAPAKTKPAEQTATNPQAQPDSPSAPAQDHGDLANFLPDIELKGISQDADLGYRASIAPFTAVESVAEAAPPSEKPAITALAEVAQNVSTTVAFNYTEPLSLFIRPEDEEITGATRVSEELPPAKPRQRPHNVVASNEAHASEAGPLAPKGEPLFELRR